MRKTIRLTGRKQLPITAFDFQMSELHGKRIATLIVSDQSVLKAMPADAEIRVRLAENKLVEILRFGTIASPEVTCEVSEDVFSAPSCQIRIVSQGGSKQGLLLGSTKTWTYKSDAQTDGILLFQEFDTAPRSWKLDIRDEERPILYLDKRIPSASLWAKTDPFFIGFVFPTIITEIFRKIFEEGSKPEEGWMAEWISWADKFMPGTQLPFSDSPPEIQKWIDELVDAFSAKHNLADGILKKLEPIS